MIRSFALAAALVLAPPATAFAQTSGDWSFALGAGSDNRSKDASKSRGDPFVFGLAEWSSEDGVFYAGPSFETIESSTGSDLELDLNGGIRRDLAGFEVDFNVAHKWQVGADDGEDADAWEFTADITRAIGPAEAGLQLQHSPDGTGDTRAWTWVAANIAWAFTDKISGDASLGRREQDASVDYTGWNVGMTYAATPNLDVDLRYHDTDADPSNPQYASALVATVTAYF
ncbi:TorF family putative porin [Brevundimonas sp.]|uniref:TorF family putative porin n=1 Tax=Brevundimonas sp. TaxID=1871086 RepID=UPI003D12AFE9